MAGPFISEHGEVVSSALAVGGEEHLVNDTFFNFSIESGQIEKIYAVDDSENAAVGASHLHTLYDVRIYRPNGSTELITKCRMLQPGFGGGINNFFEILPTDPGSDAKNDSKDRAHKRGHQVLVAFVSGRKETGIILGGLPNPNPVARSKRPGKLKGVHTEGEIQGLNFQVGNDGQLKITFNGPRNDRGILTGSNGPTSVEITKLGNILVSTNNRQSIEIDRVSGKISITNGPTFIISDQKADKVQVVGHTVEIGKGGLQPAVVGDDWLKIMEQLIDAITKLYVPTGVGPSGTPVNTPDFLSIRAKLKEALSRNHKVEK